MTFRSGFFRAASVAILGLTVSTAALAVPAEVLVTSKSAGTVEVFDSSLNMIDTVTLPMGADPTGIAVNPKGTLAAVTNFNTNRVDFLDLSVSPPAVSGISVSTAPLFAEDVAFSPDGACLVVTDGNPGSVASIDVSSRMVSTSLAGVQSEAVESIPKNPNNIVLTADLVNDEIHVLTPRRWLHSVGYGHRDDADWVRPAQHLGTAERQGSPGIKS